MTNKLTPVLLIIIAVCGAIIYSNSIHAPFLFDDGSYICKDGGIRVTELSWPAIRTAMFETIPKNRPLSNLSFALNYYFGEYRVAGYHLFNMAVHLLSGIFLLLLVKKTVCQDRLQAGGPAYNEKSELRPDSPAMIAFWASLLWIVHPVGTESVTYIVQRMTSLSAMFYILSLLLYATGRIQQRSGSARNFRPMLYFTGSALAGICAMVSKENAATLPLMILLYEWFFFQDLQPSFFKRRAWWLAVILVVSAAAVLIFLGENPIHRLLQGYARRDFTPPVRIMTEFRVVIYYISLLLYPAPGRLNLDHDFPLSVSPGAPATTFLSLITIVCIIGLAIYIARRHRLVSFCIIWFFITLLIESSFIPIEIIYDHRTYLPFMMVSVLPALLFSMPAGKTRIAAPVWISVILVFSIWTFQRNSVWADSMIFWQDCVSKSPRDARPLNNLGNEYRERGLIEIARFYYEKSVEGDPEYAVAHNNLGGVYAARGEYSRAISHLNTAVRLDPKAAKAHNNLGNVYVQLGQYDQAVHHYQKALDISPQYDLAKINLRILLDHTKNQNSSK